MKLVTTILWVTALTVAVLIGSWTALTIAGHPGTATSAGNAAGGLGCFGLALAFCAWIVA